MRISLALESLLPQERASRFTVTRERYGRHVAVVAFGRRLLVDLIR
ncbi:MAG TPA: hypothetical protein VM619_04060 [Luteimonas sp.]|nr:hypothetical protein [Luteimonas sp.]